MDSYRMLVACILSAVVLAGCGGGTEPNAQAVETKATPTPASGLTVQQVASKVAGLRATNQKLVQDFEQMCDR